VGKAKLERYGTRFLQLLREQEPTAMQAEKQAGRISSELIARQVEITEGSVLVSRVADNLSVVLLRHGMQAINGTKLNSLLTEAGYLMTVDGVKLPTAKGLELGITTIERQSDRGSYTQCMFDAASQRACVELMLHSIGSSLLISTTPSK
jgi:phage antirepressor YoqD-like protein